MTLRTLSLCLLAVAATCTACHRDAEDDAEIRIGLVVPLSGSLSEAFGRSARESAELAVRQVNDAGGLDVDGRRYRVVLRLGDGMARPDTTVQVARRLINQDGVVALVGPLLSRNALALAPVAESQRVPMISPSASHPELTTGRRYAFRVSFGDELQGRALARFAHEDLGGRSAAVLYDVTDDFNKSLARIFREVFEEMGGQVVAFESYTTGERDVHLPLTRIRDAAPDVLVLPNYADEIPSQVRQARELGIEATLLGGDAWDMELFSTLAIFDDSFMAADWNPDVETEASRAFIGAYQELHGRTPYGLAARTYDAFGLLFEAIESRGGVAGPDIRQGLADIAGYRGVTGTISFHGGGEPVKDVLILRIHGGEIVSHRRIEP